MLVRALIAAAQDAAGSYVRRIVFYAIAGVAALVAVGFLSAALHLYLRAWLGGLAASLWLGALYGVVALICVVAALTTRTPPFTQRAESLVAEETEERVAQVRAAVRGAEEALRATSEDALKKATPTGVVTVGLLAGLFAARWLRGGR